MILDRLLRPYAEAGRVYIYTSNVDGHFRHLQGFPLCEIHGCCEEWMCSAKVAYAAVELLLDAPPSNPCGDTVPLDGERFRRVREEQQRLLDLEGQTVGCDMPVAITAPPYWKMEVDSESQRARLAVGWPRAAYPIGTHIVFGGDDHNAHWDHNPPRCQCGLPLRPCVLMFGDEDAALLRLLRKGTDRYQSWEDTMEAHIEARASSKLVIFELGVGKRVEVVRQECEAVLSDVAGKGGHATLVRINPDASAIPCVDAELGGLVGPDASSRQRVICVKLTAREALQQLEQKMCTMQSVLAKGS